MFSRALSAFIKPESQYFIPLFSKISLLCGQQPASQEGMKASNEGSNSGPNSGPKGHNFTTG